MNRLAIALIAFAALGVLAWTTLQDSRIRIVALAVLGLFAVKTLLHRKHTIHPSDDED